MQRIRVESSESDYVLDDPKMIVLLILMIISFIGQLATILERSPMRYRFIPRVIVPMLCLLAMILAVMALGYMESALTGRPPPWPIAMKWNFNFLQPFTSDCMGNLFVLIAGTIGFYALLRS